MKVDGLVPQGMTAGLPVTETRRRTTAPLSAWFRIPGWASLLGLSLFPPLPGQDDALNVAGALGICSLLGMVFVARQRILPHPVLRWALVAFSLSCLLSAVIPNLPHLPDLKPLSGSLAELWNTICAATAAGLILALVRDRRSLLALVFAFTLVMFMIAVGSPLEQLIVGQIAKRLRGTEGTGNRFAGMMLVSCFWFLICGASPELRRVRMPRWALWLGAALIPLTVYFVFRRNWKSWTSSGEIAVAGSLALGIALLGSAMTVGGILYTWLTTRREVGRRTGACVGITALALNILFGLSRWILALFFALLAAVALMRLRKWRYRVLALVLLGCACFGAVRFNRRFAEKQVERSAAVRMGILRGAWRMFLEHPVVGVGCGQRAFREHWTFPSPPPLDSIKKTKTKRFSHAHNAWGQLLATQGLLGWMSFHFLYVVVVVLLFRGTKSAPSEEELERDPRGGGSPGFLRTWAARGMSVPGAVLLGMLFLQLNGLVHLPLQDCSEILYWALAAVGLASTRLVRKHVCESDPAEVADRTAKGTATSSA